MRICFTGGIIFAISAMLDDDTIAQASTRLWHSWDYKDLFCGGFIYSRRVFSFRVSDHRFELCQCFIN